MSRELGISVIAGESFGPVRQAVEDTIRTYLSPLEGGIQGTGWPLEKPLERLELMAVASRVAGVSKINEILLAGKDGVATDRIEPEHLELPKLTRLAVGGGEPMPLDELLGQSDGEETNVVPVPVIPPEC